MDPRQLHALRNPFTDPTVQDVGEYRHIEVQPDGNLLVTVLAVDR
jgi:hypothetical protein